MYFIIPSMYFRENLKMKKPTLKANAMLMLNMDSIY